MNRDMAVSPTANTKVRKAAKSNGGWLRAGMHLLGLSALALLAYHFLLDNLTANPIQFIEQQLGQAAANMLVLSLAVTPLVTLTGWKALIRHRRTLGLYAFFYFSLHLLTFAVLDYGLDWGELLRLTAEKPFILAGALAGLILLALAATSYKVWMKRMGKNWQRLHKMVYLAGGLVVLHYILAVKGSLTTLSGDILRPLGMGLLVTLLLVLRIAPVRKRLAAFGQKLRR